MRHSIGLAWIAGFLIASAAPLQAQTTIQKARDILNNRTPPPPPPAPEEPPRVETVRRTTVIIPQRQIIVVERVQARRGWWHHPRYRGITLYYDGQRFYRQPFDRRPLRKVVVYERAGRYYIDEVQWRRDHRRHYGRDYDGWKDDDKRRYDHSWQDEDRWKDEDRSKGDDNRKYDDDRKDDDNRKDDQDKGSKGDNGRHLGRDHDKDKDRN